MDFDFPIPNVRIIYTKNDILKLISPKIDYPGFQVNENEFYMNVKQVARYLVKNGEEIFIQPEERSDNDSIRLFLIGSVFGALLHQQHILPLHGSSFAYHGKGIVICGKSGIGKSSVVASFCKEAGKFICDDITPLDISENGITIVPIKTRLKLWDDAIEKLELGNSKLERIRPMMGKFYFGDKEPYGERKTLDQIYILDKHNKPEYSVCELKGLDKYNAVRNHIYRKIYLKGMPETEKVYFSKLLKLVSHITVKLIIRPQICNITDTMEFIRKEIG